jgi:hypothetical protein
VAIPEAKETAEAAAKAVSKAVSDAVPAAAAEAPPPRVRLVSSRRGRRGGRKRGSCSPATRLQTIFSPESAVWPPEHRSAGHGFTGNDRSLLR